MIFIIKKKNQSITKIYVLHVFKRKYFWFLWVMIMFLCAFLFLYNLVYF